MLMAQRGMLDLAKWLHSRGKGKFHKHLVTRACSVWHRPEFEEWASGVCSRRPKSSNDSSGSGNSLNVGSADQNK